MISPNIKWSFNQIESGLISMIGNFELTIQELVPELPICVLQTGDFSYMLNKKFVETTNKEIYQKVPRLIIGLDDIQYQQEQQTNQYNKFYYPFEEKTYEAVVRRLAVNIGITTDFVSSNLIQAFQNFEVMSTIISRDNVFTYGFLGCTLEGAYSMSTNSMEKPGMDIGSGTRNISIKNSFDLQLQILVPRVDSIRLYADSILTTQYGIYPNSPDMSDSEKAAGITFLTVDRRRTKRNT